MAPRAAVSAARVGARPRPTTAATAALGRRRPAEAIYQAKRIARRERSGPTASRARMRQGLIRVMWPTKVISRQKACPRPASESSVDFIAPRKSPEFLMNGRPGSNRDPQRAPSLQDGRCLLGGAVIRWRLGAGVAADVDRDRGIPPY